jgi:aryl-alcohol dehydrogenase-like predicted oxidoreductase
MQSKLSLGTAQWGMDYGWANERGQPGFSELEKMLEMALANGVRHLDTAQCYGNAEGILGKLGVAKAGFKINSKLNQIGCAATTASILAQLDSSLRALKVEQIESLMVHNVQDLLEPNGDVIWGVFRSLLAEERVGKIGVSVYHPEELEDLLHLEDLGIVQVPLNLYDQRFLNTDWLGKLKEQGVVIQARSIFLQGILTLSPGSLPIHLQSIREHQERLTNSLKGNGLSLVEGALRFGCSQPEVDQVVVGCENRNQLSEIISHAANTDELSFEDWEQFSLRDLDIIDPSRWPSKQLKAIHKQN